MSRGEDTMPISGTLMRSYLSNASEDKFLFLDGLPREILDDDKEEIFNIAKSPDFQESFIELLKRR